MWQITPAGDRALLITIGTAIDPACLGEVLALERALQDRRPLGLLGTVPAYASLLCHYDPVVTRADDVAMAVRELEGKLAASIPVGAVTEVPTRYGGPDLAAVAAATGLTPTAVIDLHAGQDYLVYCVGFAPGFTYCGALPSRLQVPRLPTPRTRVPAGSVGIAGRQTGVYAVESPGGWHLIGRTALPLFDPARVPPARFQPGDRIRFVPTS